MSLSGCDSTKKHIAHVAPSFTGSEFCKMDVGHVASCLSISDSSKEEIGHAAPSLTCSDSTVSLNVDMLFQEDIVLDVNVDEEKVVESSAGGYSPEKSLSETQLSNFVGEDEERLHDEDEVSVASCHHFDAVSSHRQSNSDLKSLPDVCPVPKPRMSIVQHQDFQMKEIPVQSHAMMVQTDEDTTLPFWMQPSPNNQVSIRPISRQTSSSSNYSPYSSLHDVAPIFSSQFSSSNLSLTLIASALHSNEIIPEHLKISMQSILEPELSDCDDTAQLTWLLEITHGEDINENNSQVDEVLSDISVQLHFQLVRILLNFSLVCRILYCQSRCDSTDNLVNHLAKIEMLLKICDFQSFTEAYKCKFTKDEKRDLYFSHNDIEEDAPLFNTSHLSRIVDLLPIVVSQYCRRTKHLGLCSMQLGWSVDFGECDICCSGDSFLVKRSCCNYWACRQCVVNWVTEKVFSRNVEVGCLHCSEYFTQKEIIYFLGSKSYRFYEVFVDVNKDPLKKTCPNCNYIHTIDNKQLSNGRKMKYGISVNCSKCELKWCFRCHAPYHGRVTCDKYRDGDTLVEEWSRKRIGYDKRARRCPKCRVMIEKNDGCNHMTCKHCKNEFCFSCGKDWNIGRTIRVFGNHDKKLSIFGCKNKLYAKHPVKRKLVRGALFGATLVGLTIGVPVLVGLGIGLLPILLPGAGIVYCIVRA